MMIPGRLLLVWATVLLLALGCGCGRADGWKDGSRRLLREPKDQEGYKNLLTAAQSEVRIIQQLYNGVFRDQGWANTEDFRSLLKLALNTTANLTAFFPSDDSWQRVADYYCLTQQGVLDNISNLREMLANYIKAHLVPNETLHSSDFRDGLVLQTMAQPASNPNGPAVNHTLSKTIINGTVTWVFKNASIYKIPGTYDYEDIKVNPRRMDIRAGNAIIHVMDTLFRNVDTERFWEGLRGQVLERAGYPIDSPVCPGNVTARKQEGIAPSQIAGLVIGVVIGLLLLAGVLMLIFVMRSHDSGFLHGPLKTLSATMQRRRRSESSGGGAGGTCSGSGPSGGGLDGDGDSPASGSGDMFASPLLRPPPVPPGYLQHQRSTLQHLSTASSGLTTAASWVTRGSNSSLQVLAAESPAGSMVLVNEDSPFAHVGTPVVAGAATPAGASGVLHVARQASSLAADTPTSSSAGAVHRTTDSFGSGTPFVSRGSGHGSKKDLLALAAAGAAAGGAVAHHAYGNGVEQQQQQLVDTPVYDSLGGSLAPTESVPVGRINHEHVIPFSELTLKELIGSGAEGKVYRGTWKHTDIAAKEYLPIEPAAQEVTAANGNNNGHKADSPSDAAMAHARAALAKEVHWLTSLNHPNLVRFCAVCLERPLVVMEFYKHGSVFAMLQKAARELLKSRQARRKGYVAHFNWDRRLEMLHDVAAGMSYLHGKDHVHGDLRSPNLFVGADGKVKIGDFGFTKRLACNTASLKVKRITHPRWVAPELMMDNTLSQSSDVYSFAIIMFELLTFRIPFDNLGKEQVVINVVQGFRPEVPEECDLPPGTSSSTCLFTYVRLMRECWSHDPAARPSFEVIARRLKAMQRWRTIISKHSTLHRAASALRQSSSCSSLQKQGSPVLVNGIPQQQQQYGTMVANGGMSPITNGHHHTAAAAADGASGATYPGTPSAAAAAAAGAMSLTNGASGGSSIPRPRSAQPLPVAADGSCTPLPRFGGVVARDRGFGANGSVASPSASLKQLQQQSYSPAVPEYSSSECDEESLPEFEEFEDVDGTALQQGSAPVSEAFVAGTRLAVIGVSSHQDERDALASVAGTAAELSLLARSKVVLVGSDLPAGAFSRQSVRGANSLEEGSSSVRYSRVRPASSASFTMMGLQSEPATRLSSAANNIADRRLPLASASTAATVAGAAAALATAAAKTSSSSTGGVNGRLPPNGRTQPQAAVQQPSPQQAAQAAPAAAAVVPAVRTAVAVGGAAAAAAAAAGVVANGHQVVRRHSDPLPPKTRLSADGTTAAAANSSSSPGACDDSATAMSSGQSPFAYVHVGPPDLDFTDREAQQLHDAQGRQLLPQHQSMQQPQQQQQLDMRYIQSYPLSTTVSEVGSPLPSATSTPDQLNAWQQQRLQNGKHYAIHQAQLQKLHKQQQQPFGKQQQDLGLSQRDAQQQQQQSKQVGVQQQQQQLGQQALQIQQQHRHLLESSQQPAAAQQHSQQSQQQHQQQQQPSTQQPSSSSAAAAGGGSGGLTQRHSSLTAEAVAAAAAAGPVGPPVGYEEEVFTPFDSPFYQNMSWAPSASVSGLDSNAGSFSIRNSAAVAMAAAGVVAMASDGSSICSPVHHQQLAALQQQQQLRPASFSSSAAGGAAVGEASVSAGVGPSESGSAGFGGGDLSAHTQPPSSAGAVACPPVLKQALTIEYSASLTPMAAAAAEAVSLHPGSRRSLSSAAGMSPSGAAPSSLPGSRPQSFVVAAAGGGAGAASLYAPRSCSSGPAGGAATAAAAGQFRSTPSSGSMASPAAAAAAGVGSHSSDVAAAADTGLVLLPAGTAATTAAVVPTAAASVSLEPLPAGKAAAAAAAAATPPGNKTSSSGRTTPVDQQQPLGTWSSHMDVVPPVAGAGAVGSGCEGSESAAAVQRPWWRMLGIRRSVHGA